MDKEDLKYLSSTTVVTGPGYVDFEEYSEWSLNYHKTFIKLNYRAKIDIRKMFDNLQLVYLRYWSIAMKYKNNADPRVIKAKEKYLETRNFLDQNLMLAILCGYLNDS